MVRERVRAVWGLTLLVLIALVRSHAWSGLSPAPMTIPLQSQNAGASAATPFDLAGLKRQVRLAFRPDVDGFVGGGGAHAAHVTNDGAVSVTPFHTEPLIPKQSHTTGLLDAASAALVLETRSVARGESSTPSRVRGVRVDGKGGVLIERESLEESVRNEEDGVEQSWSFSSRPRGIGDLTVRVHVSGQSFEHVTPTGIHFRDPVTGLGLRYGMATWIDAKSARIQVTPTFDAGDVVLRVPASVVEGSTYPVVLDPVVSAELGVDSPVTVSGFGQPAVAFDGTNFFLVWSESRSTGPGIGTRVYGTRVSPAGTVLDGFGIELSFGAYGNAPCVAFDGTNYLVVYQGVAGFQGIRVSTGGALLDAAPLTIFSIVGSGGGPSQQVIGFDGVNYQVVWTDQRNSGTTGTDIYAARVSKAGVTLDTSGYAVATAAKDQYSPQIACSSNGCMVSWTDVRAGTQEDVYEARLTQMGTVQNANGTPVTATADSEGGPSIAFDGTNYLVAWQNYNTTTFVYSTRAARVSSTGTVLDPNGIVLAGSNTSQTPFVTFDGTNYVVDWLDGLSSSGQVARVSKAGVLLDSTSIALGRYLWGRAAGGAGETVVASPVGLKRINSAAQVLDANPVLFELRANPETTVASAFDGTNFLLVWLDSRALTYSQSQLLQVYGARVSATGAVLDPLGIAISPSATGVSSADVAFDGTNYLVVWSPGPTSCCKVGGARVSQAGAVLDTSPIVVANNGAAGKAAIAFGSGNYLATWDTGTSVLAARVSPAGTALDGNGKTISGSAGSPAVTFVGGNYLLAWQTTTPPIQVRAARVDTNVTVLDASGILVGTGGAPAIASDGTNALVVFQDGSNPTHLRGARVSGTGTLLNATGFPVANTAAAQTAPSLTFDGAKYLAAWEDQRAGAGKYDIYGARISTSGTVLDATGIGISTTATPERRPDVVSNGVGKSLIGYDRYDPSSSFETERVRFRLLRDQANGQPCSALAECASGLCVDGVCCNAPCGGSCDACSKAAGGSIDGTCTIVPSGNAGNPPCNMLACDGVHAGCSVCNSDADCTAGQYCDATGSCVAKKPQGSPCNAAADCKAPGTCVVCATAACVDGYCCESTCAQACDVCSAVLGSSANGTCGPAAKATTGSSCAAPYACNGSSLLCPTQCASDDDCAPSYYCDPTSVCKLRKNLGASCNINAGADCKTANCRECVSGNCSDAVCCDQSCSGGCDVCTKALGASADGVCTNLPNGNPGVGCGSFVCSGTSGICPGGCASDADCSGNSYCDTGSCKAKKVLGAACMLSNECLPQGGISSCVDGVCCNNPCDNPCNACAASLKQSGTGDGICGFTKAGTDPRDNCQADPQNSCQQNGSCDGLGACQVYASGTTCGATQCVGGKDIVGKICDGKGTCKDDTVACLPYLCSGNTCTNPCTTSAQCDSKYYCASNVCVQRQTNASACTTAEQCTSGFCADGVCCDAPCMGQCESCAQTGKVGTCSTVMGTPIAPRADCKGTGVCKGTCSGSSGCTYPNQGTTCGDSKCTGDVAQPAAFCDGSGTCTTPGTKNCLPYGCNTTMGACRTTCTTDTQCAGGAQCNATTGQCAVTSNTCKDATTVIAPSGTETSCAPYKCTAGVCGEVCTTNSDCAGGASCVKSKCVADVVLDAGTPEGGAPPGDASITTQQGACGCRLSDVESNVRAPWAAASLALLLARRRGRKRAAPRAEFG
jgi:hypothetical protein